VRIFKNRLLIRAVFVFVANIDMVVFVW
jgi:hypothetical protein